MPVDSIVNAALEGQWLADIQGAAAAHSADLTDRESRQLYAAISAALDDQQQSALANLLAAGCYVDSRRTLERLRRGGVFRPSKYGYRSDFVSEVLSLLCDPRIIAHLPNSAADYLQSCQNLHLIGSAVGRMEAGLVELLQGRGQPLFKRLLATVELIFMADIQLRQPRPDRSKPTGHPYFWSREDFAEAFSYLAHLFITHVAPPNLNCPIDDDTSAAKDVLLALIIACHVRTFNEWESLVDGLGYRVRRMGPDHFVVEPPEPH